MTLLLGLKYRLDSGKGEWEIIGIIGEWTCMNEIAAGSYRLNTDDSKLYKVYDEKQWKLCLES